MRLRRLHLTRFGHFTDAVLDLGPRPEAGADFHVVYGLNEAGKTTFLNAVLRLLFGFGRRDAEPYGFRHGTDLEVGAEIEGLAGGEAFFVRRVKARNALLDDNGWSLSPTLFDEALGGLAADQYRRFFSLDRKAVEAGAEDIRNAKSETGRLLFAAHAGLSSLSATLDGVEQEAAELFKERGSSQKGAILKRRLKEIDAEIREADVSLSRYDGLAKALRSAAEARDVAVKLVGERRRALGDIDRLVDIRTVRARLRALQGRLATETAGLPDWPDDPHAENLSSLNAAAEKARAQLGLHEQNLDKLEEERRTLMKDDAALAVADRVAGLGGPEGLRSKAEGALRDYDRRRGEQAVVETLISERLTALGLATRGAPLDEQLLLDEAAIASLREAETALAKAETDLETATVERQKAEAAHGELVQERAQELAAASLDEAVATRLDMLDLEAVRREAARARETLERLRDDAEAALDALHLPGLTVSAPPETDLTPGLVRTAVATLTDLQRDKANADQAATDLAQDLRAKRRERDELEAALGGRGALDQASTRAARDAAWRTHRAALDPETADVFAEVLARDDAAILVRLEHGEDLGKLAALVSQIEMLEVRLSAAEAAQNAAMVALGDAEARERDRRRGLGLPEEITAEELAGWLQLAANARRAEVRAAREASRLEPSLDRLAAVATEVRSLVADFEGLEDDAALAQAQARLAAHREAATQRMSVEREIEKARRAVEKRREDEGLASGRLAEAENAWAEMVTERLATPHRLENPRAALPDLDAISRQAIRWREKQRSVEAMRRDMEAYVAEIERIEVAAPLRMEPARAGEADILVRTDHARRVDEALQTRVAAAERAEDRRAKIESEVKRIEDEQARAKASLDDAELGIDLYRARFPNPQALEEYAALEAAVAAARAARQLRKDVEDARIVVETKEAEAREARLDLESLATNDIDGLRAAAEAAVEDAETDRDKAVQRYGAAEEALKAVDGSDRVARLRSERAAVEEELKELARTYARKRLGLYLARLALDSYRRENRSAQMRDAGAAFTALTRSRYKELTSRTEGALDVLVATCADDGITRRGEDMSEGTRMQLFFALRLAAYRARVAHHTACPFIADDIFESFDDYRTAAACGQMEALGRIGQAIYLTHHSEVVAAALRSCGQSVRVHFLPGVPESDRERLMSAA